MDENTLGVTPEGGMWAAEGHPAPAGVIAEVPGAQESRQRSCPEAKKQQCEPCTLAAMPARAPHQEPTAGPAGQGCHVRGPQPSFNQQGVRSFRASRVTPAVESTSLQ